MGNFSAMTRLDQNRASGQLSLKIGEPITSIKKVTIWGNHSSTQFPDASQATVNGQPLSVDASWLQNEFVPTVQKRGAAVIAARKLSSAPADDWASMGVFSDGSYGTPEGVMFSFPI